MPQAPIPVFADRLARVRQALQKLKLDGYLIQNRRDQYWLTGFSGEDGFTLVTPGQVVLLTDGRFDETADREAPWARKVVRKKRGPEATVRELRRLKVGRLGFDPDHMSVKAYAELNKLARPTRLVSTSRLIAAQRECKDAVEIAAVRKAIRVAERAFEQLLGWLKPGMTERQVAARLVFEMQELGASEPAFGPIVAVGANSSLPHYEPGDTRVNESEGVLIDWGARVGWYISDLTRVVWPGSIPSRFGGIEKVVREAHDRAIAVIRPGISTAQVDRTARDHIRKSGFGQQFTHSLGHGIGLDVHEAPGLRKQGKDKLRPGMIVTIEPGVYLPGVGGVRIEDDVLVTESGYEVLSSLPAILRR